MIESTVGIATPDGRMEAFVCCPERGVYDRPSAERRRERLIALYRRRPG